MRDIVLFDEGDVETELRQGYLGTARRKGRQQTNRECVREHGCDNVSKCPLRGCFTGIEFGATKGKAKTDSGRYRD